jgi:uncharacterized membrane protein
MKVVRISALGTSSLYQQELFLVFISVGAHGGAVVGHYATNRKVAGSISDGVIGIFH